MQVKFVVRKEVGVEGKTLWIERSPELMRTLWPTGKAHRAALFDTAAEAAAVADEYQRKFFVSGYKVAARLHKPRNASVWQCPIEHKGCARNCGNYGCGN